MRKTFRVDNFHESDLHKKCKKSCVTIIASREALSFSFFLNCLLRTNIEINVSATQSIHPPPTEASLHGSTRTLAGEMDHFAVASHDLLLWSVRSTLCERPENFIILSAVHRILHNNLDQCNFQLPLTLYFPTKPQQLNGRPENGEIQNKSMTSIRWLFDKDDYREFAEFYKRKFIA